MRDQYKVLAEKYEQIQEAPPAFDLIGYLADGVETWQYHVGIDMPYDITYPDFIEFVIKDDGFNSTAKAMWDALTPREKKRTYQKVIHILAKKHGAEDMDWYPDPDEERSRVKASKLLKKGSEEAGVNLDI